MINHTKVEYTLKTNIDMGMMIIGYGGGWDIISTKKGNRYIVCKISNGREKLNLVNLHAPSKFYHLRGQFYSELTEVLLQEEDNFVVAGDFNVVLEDRDKDGNQKNSGREELQALIDLLGLKDSYRVTNPNTIDFTLSTMVNNGRIVRSRADRIYVPDEAQVDKAYHIHHGSRWTDHSAASVNLFGATRTKGSPHWKLNETFLEDPNFIDYIEGLIWISSQGLDSSSVRHKWEELIANIRRYSIEFGKELAAEERREITILRNILALKGENAREEFKSRLDQLVEKKLQGCRVRSRIKDAETEDLNYFICAERKLITSKNVKAIRTREGHLTCNKQEIAHTFHEFFTDLYTESEKPDAGVQAHYLAHVRALSDDDRESIDMNIGREELKRACFAMELGKSPGPNGLTVKFFRTFFESLAPFLVLLVNSILDEESVPSKVQLAYMILLLKDEKNPEDPKNYRPISLLNVEYKLITRSLASKLSLKISSLVNLDQACSVPGRSIIHHNHYIRDLITHADIRNEKAAILSLDQAKAFDRVSHSWLCKVLRACNLPELFVKWVEILYSNANSQILVNNELSSVLELERGVRQGCSLSPMLYILTLEPLLNAIRSNDFISGIQTPPRDWGIPHKQKVLAYADDTNFFSTSSRSLDLIIDEFQKFGTASGSSVNVEKSKAMLIGHHSTEFACKHPIKWVTKITMFGLTYSRHGGTQDNWEGLLKEIGKTLDRLYTRRTSVFSRAIIANTRIIPKLMYRLHTLDIDELRLRKFVAMLRQFMNKGNGIRYVRYPTLTQPLESGGAALRNLEVSIMSNRLKLLRLMMANVWPSPLSQYYLGARLLRLGIRPDNRVPHYEGTNTPPFYANLLRLLRMEWPPRKGYGPRPIKLTDLVISQPTTTYYTTLNAQIHEQDKILLDQMPGAPKNVPGYDPKQSFVDLHRARLRTREKWTIYRLFYSALPSRQNMTLRNRHGVREYQSCCICGDDRETIQHLFLDCLHLKETLIWLHENLQPFRKGGVRYAIFALYTKADNDEEIHRLRQESIIIFVNTIWRIRTNILSSGNQGQYTEQLILTEYKAALRRHLRNIFPETDYNF